MFLVTLNIARCESVYMVTQKCTDYLLGEFAVFDLFVINQNIMYYPPIIHSCFIHS